jgi:hypothetical protein
VSSEALSIQRVDRDVQAIQARRDEVGEHVSEPDAVGRHRDLDGALRTRDRGKAAHDVDDVGAQQRLATGQAERRDAGCRGDARDPHDLVGGQEA